MLEHRCEGLCWMHGRAGPRKPDLASLVGKEPVAGTEEMIFKAHVDGVEIAYEDLAFHPEEGPVYTDGSSLHYGTAAEAS